MTRVLQWPLCFSWQVVVAVCWLCAVDVFGQTASHIDFNPDNGRSDVRTLQAFNWPVGTCVEMEQTVGNIQVRIKAAGPSASGLTFCWWKAGYDSGATLCSDGITTETAGDGIEMTLAGFSAGKHNLVTWHNVCDQQPATAPFRIRIFDQTAAGDMELSREIMVDPGHRVTHDDDGKTCSIEFDVKAGSDVVLRILPTLENQSVVINGLAWDIPNPAKQTTKHWPVDQDEHVPVNPELTWQAPPEHRDPDGVVTVRKYHVFFGTDRDRVLASTQSDVAYLGATSSTRFSLPANDCLLNYFWRVDCEFADGVVTPGTVRRFRTRHLAFPGAEGYGRFAIGGRGGRVLEVTNLDDSGPGSLRAAVESDGPRTVVFRVGGTIKLQSKLLIRNPYITIAGQTAPGDGICVRGYTFGCFGTHDVIMRFVRIRVGDESHETMDGTGFASTDHSIFDHCSISWSIDEAVSSRSARNITLQRCIVSEALNVADHRKYQAGKGHSFAASISGNIGSFHHNLLAHCAGRNWSLAGGLNNGGQFAGRLDIRNNVVFNWEHRTNDGGVKALNLVNNLYIPGPATRVFHLLKPDIGSPEDRQQYFVSGNSMEGRFGPEDNWQAAVITAPETLDAIRLDQPFCESHVTTCSAEELLDNVLADVGANHSGLDDVDQRIIQNVRQRDATFKGSRTGLPGIIDSQADVGGWPELKTGTAPPDTDHDGMADAWEMSRGLDPNHPDHNNPGNNKDGSGAFATMLEEYLSELCTRP